MFIKDSLFSKKFTAITKGAVRIKVCKVKGSQFQKIEAKAEKMYKAQNYNTEIAQI